MLPILRQLRATCYSYLIKYRVLTNASPKVTAAILSAIAKLMMLSFMGVLLGIVLWPV
jgi:hypothetical protein